MRIGVDLQTVSRFARVAARERLRGLLFTEAELDHADRLGPRRATEWLAGRFSAKEAVYKLLGRGFGQGPRWREIEVLSDRWGAPAVTLEGEARRLADRAGLRAVTVTLTHQADLVVAVAAADRVRPRSAHYPKRSDSPIREDPTPGREPFMTDTLPESAEPRLREIATIAAEVFSVSVDEVIAAESFTEELAMDSLLALEFLTHLETTFGVRIDETESTRMTNLRTTYQVVAETAGW
ncbi:4'-phosphopantetheinyl transferase superfamily protein [Streptomyces sp. AA0539]|uniref:4'-phosphopantetheinyl transferase superfamily protein n=1 Tax=Streptomyces sp. AA0539 TaxID=1210045 RepID=UPI0002D4647B|nr:4'-phosphopantetheinyl transferase superfamily protein [Streptomyces sp. AA0539]